MDGALTEQTARKGQSGGPGGPFRRPDRSTPKTIATSRRASLSMSSMDRCGRSFMTTVLLRLRSLRMSKGTSDAMGRCRRKFRKREFVRRQQQLCSSAQDNRAMCRFDRRRPKVNQTASKADDTSVYLPDYVLGIVFHLSSNSAPSRSCSCTGSSLLLT